MLRLEKRRTLENLETPVREEGEADVLVALLDVRVEGAEVVAVGAGEVRRVQGLGDGLVVLVDRDYDAAADGPVPLVVGRQALEEIVTALEERLGGADERTLAEAAWTG